MASQVNPSSASLWRRIINVLRGEGLGGVVQRIQDHRKTDFAYHFGHMVIYPLGESAGMPPNPLGLAVEEVSADDTRALADMVEVYGPPYNVEFLLVRCQQQGLLGFLGRINGEAVTCVWAKPDGTVIEFGKPALTLAADEVYFKDAWTKPVWRGKGLYPVTVALAGQILHNRYGKNSSYNFILTTNHASLNAYRKVGGLRAGSIRHFKVFRKNFVFLKRDRPRPLEK